MKQPSIWPLFCTLQVCNDAVAETTSLNGTTTRTRWKRVCVAQIQSQLSLVISHLSRDLQLWTTRWPFDACTAAGKLLMCSAVGYVTQSVVHATNNACLVRSQVKSVKISYGLHEWPY